MDQVHDIKNKEPQSIDTLQLSNEETYKLSYKAKDASMFEIRDRRTFKQIETEAKRDELNLANIQKDKNSTYAARRTASAKAFRSVSSGLYQDKKWYSSKDSPEMVRVKKTVAFLHNLLDQGIYDYIYREEGGVRFDAAALKDTVHKAFEEAMTACQNYMEQKRNKKQGRWSTGIRRMQIVDRLYHMCLDEREKYESTVDAIQSGSLKEEFKLEDVAAEKERRLGQLNEIREEEVQEVEEQQEEKFNLSTLSTLMKTTTADTTEWQNQGNSTDVYRIKVQEKGSDKFYYIKENLPLISADMDGFLDRRLTQLNSSKQAHANNDTKNEEQRMREAGMKEADYDACTKFLETIKRKIKGASAADHIAVRKQMADLLAHDFDKLFIRWHNHNAAAEYVDKAGGKFDLAMWEKIAADKSDTRNDIALILVKHMREMQSGDGQKEVEPLKPIDAKDWVIKELGLERSEYKEIRQVVTELFEQDKSGQLLENMFRISLGKEVELYGQMRDRTGGDAEEVTATNNTATSKLAEFTGFSDVVAVSDNRIVKFKDRNGNEVESFCTVMEEAEGQEFLDLLQQADRENKKIEYTPEVVRQLMRLQCFDTVCLQVDRHGRNFKCKTRVEGNKIIITQIKSYDHDMSFGEETLKNSFKDGEDKGFLKNPTMRIKKDSALYKYWKKKYFLKSRERSMDFLDKIKEPNWKETEEYIEKNSGYGLRGIERVVKHGSISDFLDQPFRNINQLGMNFGGFSETKSLKYQTTSSVYSGKIKDKDGNALSEEEHDRVEEQFGALFLNFKNLLWSDRKQGGNNKLKEKLSKEEKADLTKYLRELYEMYQKYDFRGIEHRGIRTKGLVDLWIKKILFTYSEILKADRDNATLEEMIDSDATLSDIQKAKKKDALSKLQDKNGDIVVPALLHYDLDAYMELKKMQASFGNGAGNLSADLKNLNFRNEKIEALKKRCDETIEMIEKAKEKAEAFYELAGWEENTVQTKFFLEEKDYSQIKDFSELSVDPGKTYLSIDNENYLFGDKDYREVTTQAERNKALAAERKKQTDSKRGKNPDYLKGLEPLQAMEKFLDNALSGGIAAA